MWNLNIKNKFIFNSVVDLWLIVLELMSFLDKLYISLTLHVLTAQLDVFY